MRTFIFIIALLFSGAAYASPDCSNYGGNTLAGCGAADFPVGSGGTDDHKLNNGSIDVGAVENKHEIDLNGNGVIGR